jgi:predicted NAD/FAD-binding protein
MAPTLRIGDVAQRIAIIGTGVSGLGAAWALNPGNEITVYEADDRIGGHAHTVDVAGPEGVTSVDTGFIVYNETTYPNLTRLFDLLEVPTEPSDMSFSLSVGELEYGASLGGILARPANIFRPRFVRMLADIDRFRRMASDLDPIEDETIGEFLARHRFGDGFVEDYLYPMTGAIWSAGRGTIAGYPASSILAFMHNHGLIEIVGRPRWRTVAGGSRSYLRRVIAGFEDRIRLSTPVESVRRLRDGVVVSARGATERFDHVVFATHSDQALRILGDDATEAERRLLGAIRYQMSEAVLHSDPGLMPGRRGVWSAWNAMGPADGADPSAASVTYWMNRLQNLDPSLSLFVSLNPSRKPKPDLVHGRYAYAHPVFDRAAVGAQAAIARLQGRAHTWFAGAYLGYGFHEDGLQSGLNVAAALGSPAPWHGSFTPKSSARYPVAA